MKTVEVKVIDQKPFTPIHSHPLLSTPTHSHPLPSTAIHPQPLPPTPTHSMHSHPFVAHCHLFPLFLVHSTQFKPTPAHVQPLSPISRLLANTLTHSNPYLYPCVLRSYVLYVPVRLQIFVFHVPMCLCSSFLCILLPMSIYFTCFCIVNRSGPFIYIAFFKNILVISVLFLL